MTVKLRSMSVGIMFVVNCSLLNLHFLFICDQTATIVLIWAVCCLDFENKNDFQKLIATLKRYAGDQIAKIYCFVI